MNITRGQKFIRSLDDDRSVWLDGSTVNVTEHQAFQGTLGTISNLFDMLDESDYSKLIGFKDENTGRVCHNAFLVPRTQEHLAQRASAFRVWAESTHGVMSRLSDYARSRITGWYATRERYRTYDKHFADKLAIYYEEAKMNDLFLTAIQREPQIDRSKSIGEDPDMILRVVGKNSEGLIVRGAKMIATAGPYSNDLIVYPLARIPREHPEYAHMMIVPANSSGLHMMCRESYAKQPNDGYPISERYDEMDAVLFFDNVLVPWERVLLHDHPEAVWAVRSNEASSSLAYHQTIVRLQVKLEFVSAIAFAIAQAIGIDQFLNIQVLLGELVSQIRTIEGLILAAESAAKPDEFGNLIPTFTFIETARNLGSKYYPRSMEILQTLGAGGFFQMPSNLGELDGPLSPFIQKYLRGANVDSSDKIRLFRLAWEFIGSPLGSRHELYERYYAGDPVRNFANQYLSFDKSKLVDKLSSALPV